MYEIFEQLLQNHKLTAYRLSQEIGVSQSTLSDWKRGRSTPKQDKMQKIADYFGVTLEYLMTGEDFSNGIEDEFEYKLGQVSFGNDEKKKEFLEVMMQLDDYEEMDVIKNIALKFIDAKKKG